MAPNDFEANIIEWNAQLMRDQGGMLEITLMPIVSVEMIPTATYTAFAKLMRRVNSIYGVPVLLRFMHEMNGPWMPYGMKPIEQRAAWTIMSREIRAQTNMTALIWSPNIGGGYPYLGAGFDQNIPSASSGDPATQANFQALATNGRLLDPYGPYYPGIKN